MKIIALVTALFGLTTLLFSFLPVFPSIDPRFLMSIQDYFGQLCQYGSGILGFFIDNWALDVALGMSIFIYTAEPIYWFIHWMLKKLPFNIGI